MKRKVSAIDTIVLFFIEAMRESGTSENKRMEVLQRVYKKIESLHETEGK